MPIEIREGSPGLGLALSGGGSRAMAFHLGCLKALDEIGLLEQVATISAVSGGSVIAALYCSHPGSFKDFESKVRDLLAQGFVKPSIKTALSSLEAVKAITTIVFLTADRALACVVRQAVRFPPFSRVKGWRWLRESQIRRSASRTTILRKTLSKTFEGRKLTDLRSDRPSLVVVACELRAKAAFYFTKEKIHCWRYGSASSEDVEIADAVTASAAYPLALPAIDKRMAFEKNGKTTTHRVTLTDGGVYDNLGLAPLWPGRDSSVSLDVGSFDRIIACRAGYALDISDSSSLVFSRINSAFESIFARAQNLATNRLFDLKRSGEIKDFLLPYLGQKDSLLSHAPRDLVTEQIVSGYPTNFSAMNPVWIDRLSRRGEQIVHALVAEYWSKSDSR